MNIIDISQTPGPAFGGPPDGFTKSEPPSLLSSSSQQQQMMDPLHRVLANGHEAAKGHRAVEDNYCKRSVGLAVLNKTDIQALIEALDKVHLPSRGPVVVADLGCSSGTYSIDNIALITDKLKLRLPKDAEFFACFNDLRSDNLNNLFKLWTSDYCRASNIFASKVTGSHVGRLFPRSFVHIFHSSMSLHWLSKVPDEVLDKNSPAYNKGQTWIMNSSSAVAEAYQKQAKADLENFLLARAAELAPGGVLVCYFLGSSLDPSDDPFDTTWGQYIGQDTNDIWTDLIAEGLLTEEQRDSFNFPVYPRNFVDLNDAIGSCGTFFHPLKVTHRAVEVDIETDLSRTSDLTVTADPTVEPAAKRVKAMYKSSFGVLLEAHVGKNAAEVIVERFGTLVERKMREDPGLYGTLSEGVCVVSLIRK